MPFVRKEIWNLGGGWNETTLWYAKGVRAMQERPITDPTSWTYQAAMHGFKRKLWEEIGYLKPDTELPSQKSWEQCQHQSWYFLPWHRGYVAAFEAIVRDAIVQQGGPENWALPYWNYSNTDNPQAPQLPTCFSDKTLPDGSPNPLYVERRYGEEQVDGHIWLEANRVSLEYLQDDDFTSEHSSDASIVAKGFGGPVTCFSHDGDDNKAPTLSGGLESKPHNKVHVGIGGQKNVGGGHIDGLMRDPDTAALDPVFWVHHANIDRLWQVWLDLAPEHQNPSDEEWLKGPAKVEIIPSKEHRPFTLFHPDGASFDFTPRGMLDTTAPDLNYVYEPTYDPVETTPRRERRLLSQEAFKNFADPIAMKRKAQVELLGANDTTLNLVGAGSQTTVRLDKQVRQKVENSLQSFTLQAAPQQAEPDRVFLRLDGIRSQTSVPNIRVLVGVAGSDESYEVGLLSLFGVAQASRNDGKHAGNGLNEVFEITELIDKLHLEDQADLSQLQVQLVPSIELAGDQRVSIERISLYRLSE